jgi:hypothetical protein
VIELVLSDQIVQPIVEKLSGPLVRISINPSHNLNHALETCRTDLHEAVEWALTSLYENDDAPHRVFVSDASSQQMVTTTDPCLNYGSQAIIRP